MAFSKYELKLFSFFLCLSYTFKFLFTVTNLDEANSEDVEGDVVNNEQLIDPESHQQEDPQEVQQDQDLLQNPIEEAEEPQPRRSGREGRKRKRLIETCKVESECAGKKRKR